MEKVEKRKRRRNSKGVFVLPYAGVFALRSGREARRVTKFDLEREKERLFCLLSLRIDLLELPVLRRDAIAPLLVFTQDASREQNFSPLLDFYVCYIKGFKHMYRTLEFSVLWMEKSIFT